MSVFHGGILFPISEGNLRAATVKRCDVCLRVDEPAVKVGDLVAHGQVVGTIAERVQHATIAGKVTRVEDGLLRISHCTPDERDDLPTLNVTPFGKRTGKTLLEATPEELLEEIRNAGIVEADGSVLADRLTAALGLSRSGKLRMAAVSLLESDPASLSLSSLGLEFAGEIAGGLAILLRFLSLREGIILCDKARPNVVSAIRDACTESRLIAVETVENRYPQANPKLLTRYFCQRELSPQSTPEAAGLFLIDAECCVAIHRLFATGIPRLSVRTTIWEAGVGRVYDLPLGMDISALWELKLWKTVPAPQKRNDDKKSLIKPGEAAVICRGLMSGAPAPDTVDRSLAVLTPVPDPVLESDCIRCGRCAEVCPMYLQPYRFQPQRPQISFLNGSMKDAVSCIGCGACSYVCPARIPLRRYVLRAKQEADLARKV